MKILALSDIVVPFVYSPQVRQRFAGVDLVIGCGDLAYYYLEYAYDMLNAHLFYVRGNHDKIVEYSIEGQRVGPAGGINLHRRSIYWKGLLLAGVEGSLRYRPGQFQYTQSEMWKHVLYLVPSLLVNRILYGRFLDLFVTHAPSAGVHDQVDLPHQGIGAFRWLVRVFQPSYHIHGHVHIYRPDTIADSLLGKTRVVNAFGYREIELQTRKNGVVHTRG